MSAFAIDHAAAPRASLRPTAQPTARHTTGRVRAGRMLSTIVVLFLLFDCTIKLLQVRAAVEGTAQLGYPRSAVAGIGVTLLVCLVLYAVPRTAFVGALLLTGYLGGAVASQVRIGSPLFGFVLFPVYVAALAWAGLYLRDPRLRALVGRR